VTLASPPIHLIHGRASRHYRRGRGHPLDETWSKILSADSTPSLSSEHIRLCSFYLQLPFLGFSAPGLSIKLANGRFSSTRRYIVSYHNLKKIVIIQPVDLPQNNWNFGNCESFSGDFGLFCCACRDTTFLIHLSKF